MDKEFIVRVAVVGAGFLTVAAVAILLFGL